MVKQFWMECKILICILLAVQTVSLLETKDESKPASKDINPTCTLDSDMQCAQSANVDNCPKPDDEAPSEACVRSEPEDYENLYQPEEMEDSESPSTPEEDSTVSTTEQVRTVKPEMREPTTVDGDDFQTTRPDGYSIETGFPSSTPETNESGPSTSDTNTSPKSKEKPGQEAVKFIVWVSVGVAVLIGFSFFCKFLCPSCKRPTIKIRTKRKEEDEGERISLDYIANLPTAPPPPSRPTSGSYYGFAGVDAGTEEGLENLRQLLRGIEDEL